MTAGARRVHLAPMEFAVAALRLSSLSFLLTACVAPAAPGPAGGGDLFGEHLFGEIPPGAQPALVNWWDLAYSVLKGRHLGSANEDANTFVYLVPGAPAAIASSASARLSIALQIHPASGAAPSPVSIGPLQVRSLASTKPAQPPCVVAWVATVTDNRVVLVRDCSPEQAKGLLGQPGGFGFDYGLALQGALSAGPSEPGRWTLGHASPALWNTAGEDLDVSAATVVTRLSWNDALAKLAAPQAYQDRLSKDLLQTTWSLVRYRLAKARNKPTSREYSCDQFVDEAHPKFAPTRVCRDERGVTLRAENTEEAPALACPRIRIEDDLCFGTARRATLVRCTAPELALGGKLEDDRLVWTLAQTAGTGGAAPTKARIIAVDRTELLLTQDPHDTVQHAYRMVDEAGRILAESFHELRVRRNTVRVPFTDVEIPDFLRVKPEDVPGVEGARYQKRFLDHQPRADPAFSAEELALLFRATSLSNGLTFALTPLSLQNQCGPR